MIEFQNSKLSIYIVAINCHGKIGIYVIVFNMKHNKSNYDGVDNDVCKLSTNQQEKYFKKCMYLAQKSDLTQKHGCIIVRNNEIISSGYNFKIKNNANAYHKLVDKYQCTYSVHAEVSTLKKIKEKKLTNCEMYVVRLGTYDGDNFQLKYSHPCETCSCQIKSFGINKVYYSINSSFNTRK